MIRHQFFPRSRNTPQEIIEVVECFKTNSGGIDSAAHNLHSNEVLAVVSDALEKLGFTVEQGKTKAQKINVPVLFGQNDSIDKHFDADALSKDGRIVIEVEAGRGVVNNQFLKDIFQACMMSGVKYLVIAVRNDYRGADDFSKVYAFLETLYVSNRLVLPLDGIAIIGY